jgi:5-methylcytosine-specific restriction protein A
MKIPASGELHGRAVEEWIGKTPDSVVPDRVKLRVLLRQSRRCAISGDPIRPGAKTQCDHKIRLRDGGENRESNLQIILVEAHQEKTAQENSDGAKAARTALKHLGLWNKPKRKIPSRPFSNYRRA